MPNPNKHRPFHIYYGHTYFITGRCYEQKHYFNSYDRKQIFIAKFSTLTKKFNIKIYAWSLLSNHYHIIVSLPQTEKYQTDETVLPAFKQQLHGQTASVLNINDKTPGRQVWYQYWDYCIRNEADFWRHFNYIVQQPLKHGIVKTL